MSTCCAMASRRVANSITLNLTNCVDFPGTCSHQNKIRMLDFYLPFARLKLLISILCMLRRHAIDFDYFTRSHI